MAPPELVVQAASTAPAAEGSTSPQPSHRRATWPLRIVVAAVAVALVLAYALPNGAYDIVVRQEYGLVVWWVLAVGIALGLLPRARPSRAVLIAGAALLVFCAWTGLSLVWTQSAERTTAELARSLGYLGLFALIVAVVDRRIWRAATVGVGLGAMAVCALSVASRLDPGAFPANTVGSLFQTSRLAYPFAYWNAVAAWGAMSTAIGLGWSANDGSPVRRAVALGCVPIATTMTYLSGSRAGVGGTALALIVVVGVSKHRYTAVLHAAVAAGGTAIVIASIRSHPQIAHADGGSGGGAVLLMLLLAVVLCAAGSLLTLFARVDRWRLPRRAALTVASITVLALAIAGGAFGPHLVSRAWHQFKNTSTPSSLDPAKRLTSLSGTRYNLWKVAFQEFERKPLTGSGAGTYEFVWNQHQLDNESVRNAHSLWLETMSELGLPGLLAIVAVAVSLCFAGVRERLRSRRRSTSAATTAFVAAFAVFLLHASVDWMWQVTAVTALAIAGIAVIAGHGATRRLKLRLPWRAALALLCAGAAFVQLPGLISTLEIRRSQSDERHGNGAAALAWARAAVSAEPWAASPYVQRALVEEAAGELSSAAADLTTATQKEPTNFRQWALLARVQAERGDVAAAERDYAQARRLARLATVL